MIGVISGDFIKSSDLRPDLREKLYNSFENYLKSLSQTDSQFIGETNRGDWFQCLLQNPVFSLRYTLIIKTFLRSLKIEGADIKEGAFKGVFDARMSIGIGEADFIGTRLGNSDGPAFRVSGRLLEDMKKSSRAMDARTDLHSDVNQELATIFQLLDFIISKTTAMQCEVIHRKLLGKKEKDIAEELHILQSAVNQRSSAAGWNAIESALLRFETIITKINE